MPSERNYGLEVKSFDDTYDMRIDCEPILSNISTSMTDFKGILADDFIVQNRRQHLRIQEICSQLPGKFQELDELLRELATLSGSYRWREQNGT